MFIIRHLKPTLFAASLVFAGHCSHLEAAVDLVTTSADSSGFPLVTGGVGASLILPQHCPEVVSIAANDLANDISKISGTRPEVVAAAATGMPDRPRIELLIAPDLAEKWEAFRLTATTNTLTIAASDARGLAYGIYEISRRIGVSPWHWWADVPPPRRADLHLTLGSVPLDQPAVKYRGIFLNDEDWGLQPWAAKTFEPEVGDIGPKTYGKIFELMLRLRANTLWPAMHESTRAFHSIPENAATADRYAIILGSSHAEPMLRNNVGEWKVDKARYNYLTNREGVLRYWEDRVKERRSGESLFTLGMRGIHDSPIVGPKGQQERIQTLESIFTQQRGLLARYLGKGDPSRVAQIFCPYKEVLDDYLSGLRVPPDVTIVYPDDNFGYVRRFGTETERNRSGGLGVYYHASYLGAPLAWLWIDTLPPAFIWSEMTRAYEQGAHKVWIINAGDIKGTERSTEFFLDLAWHADRTDLDAPARFIRESAARDFGDENSAAVADLLTRLHTLNFARKTEHLQWHPTLERYKPTELNETEIARRLDECAHLLHDSEAVAKSLPAAMRDAYFELVGYPILITAAANERYFRSELARADEARGRAPKANQDACATAQTHITEITSRYNNNIAAGKWRNSVIENGVSPKQWTRFQRDRKIIHPSAAVDNVCPPPTATPSPIPHPAGAVSGDFVERDGVISMLAGNFSNKTDLSSGAGWRAIPGLGRSGSAVTILPSTTQLSSDSAPSLDYRFHVTTKHPATVHFRLLPTHPLTVDQGLRFAVSIDGASPIPITVTRGFDPKSKEWPERVLSNATEITLKLPNILTPGVHTLRLIAVDAGVVMDKIVINLGGLHPSYDGPAETRLRNPDQP